MGRGGQIVMPQDAVGMLYLWLYHPVSGAYVYVPYRQGMSRLDVCLQVDASAPTDTDEEESPQECGTENGYCV